MLYRRNQLYRRKIIGGSLLGDIFDKAKGLISSGAKTAISSLGSQAKNILKSGTSKILSNVKDVAKSTLGVDSLTRQALTDRAKQAVKSQFDAALQKGQEIAQTKLSSLGRQLGKAAVDKVKTTTKIPQSVKDTISSLASNPQVKKALTDKAREIIKRPQLNANSAAMLSNIIAGNGIKRIV